MHFSKTPKWFRVRAPTSEVRCSGWWDSCVTTACFPAGERGLAHRSVSQEENDPYYSGGDPELHSGPFSFCSDRPPGVVVTPQFGSVAQLYPTVCNPMGWSTPGFPVHHQLPEFTQTRLHWSVMPSNHLILCRQLLLLPSVFPRVFSNLQCSSSHLVAKVLEFQHQSFQ